MACFTVFGMPFRFERHDRVRFHFSDPPDFKEGDH